MHKTAGHNVDSDEKLIYSKTCLKRSFKIDIIKVLNTNCSLMTVKSIAEYSIKIKSIAECSL